MSYAHPALLLALLLPGAVQAQAPVPPDAVCGRREVLDIVAADISRGDRPSVIVPGDIGQVPTERADTVRCAVRVTTRYFDTNRFGYVPLDRPGILEFSVRAGRNGLFVESVGPVP